MAYTEEDGAIVIDGFEKGISSSPYTGIADMVNMGISYYPSVAYVNYKRLPATLASLSEWYAGTHSVDVSGNSGWIFTAPAAAPIMDNPVAYAKSPVGLNYILDHSGQVWKQAGVNVPAFNLLEGGSGRVGNGNTGIAYWNNYLVVFGDGMIEFCGNGTDDSGVTSDNWNLTSIPGMVDVTSSILLQTTYSWTGTVLAGATTATLTTPWQGVTGNYFVQFGTTSETRVVTFTNIGTSVSWTGGLSNNENSTFFMYQMTATPGTFTGYTTFVAGQQVTFSSTGTLPTGIIAATPYYLLDDVDLTGGTVFTFSNGLGGAFIPLTDAGTGTITMSLLPSIVPPIENTTITNITWSKEGTGSTTFSLPSPWLGATGVYNVVDPLGNNIQALFTYESSVVSLLNPATVQAAGTGTFLVQIVNPTAPTNKTWVSKVDGNLYFANGRWVGAILTSPNLNAKFNPGVTASYSVSYAITGTLQSQDMVVDLTDLNSKLIILGNFDAYPWDYVSAQPDASFPIGEQTTGIINILNNVYIFAGQKGNVYVSNGYSAQVLYKVPDQISGVIDPVWSWGGYMFHRGKLFFQVTAQDTSGNYLLTGTFSLNVSATLVTDIETANSFTQESQNSSGLIPAAGATTVGLLIDDEPSSQGQDSYYSSYSIGSSEGLIDYNDTTLWQNNEPFIVTDIIPIGTILDKKTFGNIEFKLDRPMVVGDSISLYWRPSLTENYQFIGTTTTEQLSEYFPSNISQSQWAQFKITFKCSATNSSFIPLREVRLYFN